MGLEAWITSAVEDRCVNKAIALAGSLRRVQTSKKLIVLSTVDVTKKLRDKLEETFDLVHLLDVKPSSGLNVEDYAKAYGFSLSLFTKCVYLAPTTLVLKNCDEIFARYGTIAASQKDGKNEIDSSVLLYTPSVEYGKALSKVAFATSEGGNFFEEFANLCLKNGCLWDVEKLDDKYNLRIELKGGVQQSLSTNASIINFVDNHPLDLDEETIQAVSENTGSLEKFAVDYCWTIYLEDVKVSPLDTTLTDTPQGTGSAYKNEPIAIVGVSFRLPGGNNADEFWSMLAEGKGAVVPVPPHRWSKEHSYFLCQDRNVEVGFLNVPVDEFDGKFFSFSLKEAELVDPQQRLLLEVTWEALEDAMIDPLTLMGSQTGVFVGSWVYDYKDICCHAEDVDFFRVYMGNSIAGTAARISHFLETTGPSIATESGCSSAMAAVSMACKSLRSGDCNLAVAAGVNLILHPFQTGMIDYLISRDFRCKTFDAEANGFARAEACVSIILKRHSDAIKDEDNIWGLIRGTALTQEGLSKSWGTPTVHCESMAMEIALKDAGVHPSEVSYVEAHGTGTAVGDPLEILSITKAYSAKRSEPLIIGSVKTNVGHTESVSGLTGIIKVLLSMKNEMIPKHLNLKTLNPQINLDAIPAQIPLEPIPWPKNDRKRRIAGVSSFGMSGTDGHAIIEEPPRITKRKQELGLERPIHIMKISAKSSESMDKLLVKYQNIFKERIENYEDNEKDFANIAYSANIGRSTFNHRAVIIARNFEEAANILEKKSFIQADIHFSSQRLCFLFTGQGSQYPNMGKQLYETSPVFRDCFNKCDKILRKRYNISIKNVLWTNDENIEDLSKTLYSQTSIFVLEYCLLKLWDSWGVQPDYVMGHSLGEFAAAVAAGALNLEDSLMLVAERSRLIDNLPQGKMLVIKADINKVDEMISEFQKIKPDFWVDYAALNSPDQTVVAGDTGVIEEFEEFCKRNSLKAIVLAATHAFHSRHMEPMLEAYKKVASTVRKQEVKEDYPKYISGVEGRIMEVDEIDADYWVNHTREKVSFMDACKAIEEEGCTLFLEVGPHPVLLALTMRNMEGSNLQITCFPSIRKKEDEWVTMLDTLSKLYLSDWKGQINWSGFDRIYSREKVKLPFYPFNRKSAWTRFEKKYWKIHPLIGSFVPTASGDTIFQSSLTLKNTNFLQDHAIGNTVVFPGAGFLEMCLAGGYSTVQNFTDDFVKPRRPIALQSLKIGLVLALNEYHTCKLQTVITLGDKKTDPVNYNSEPGYNVQVHRQMESENGSGPCQWIEHASAIFRPVVTKLDKRILQPIDINHIQSTWERGNNSDFYDKLPNIGLRFGPKFQSLEFCWKSEKGLLTSIKLPEDHRQYLLHPIVVDAMFQTVMLWMNKGEIKKKLQVPVQIDEFIWLKEIASESSTTLFAYSSSANNGAFCILLEKDGTPLAYMRGLDVIETTAKLVERMVTQHSSTMPKLWQDVWKPSRGPMQGYLKNLTPPEQQPYSDDDLEYFYNKNKLSERELRHYQNLVNISRLSVLKALYTLGWKPRLGDIFSIDFLMTTLKIKERYRKYIRFFMRNMSQKEYALLIAQDEEENTFKFVYNPPSMEEIEAGLQNVTSPNDVLQEDYRLVKEVEYQLVKILSGQVDPLAILFSDRDDTNTAKPSVVKYYNCLAAKNLFPRHTRKIEIHMLSATQTSATSQSEFIKPTYRCLEVGAGTAIFAQLFLNHVFSSKVWENVEIEYYFTDISASFFSAAEKIFKDHEQNILFKKFDMEKDPLEQGFCPGYFDMITATEVFHVAKDIQKTLRNVRSLLKPGGLLHFIETVKADPRNTFMFGLLDGFWRFEDKQLRTNHVSLSLELWEQVLNDSGFNGFTMVPLYNNLSAVMTAYASPVENIFLKDLYPVKNSWIIFGEHDDLTVRLLFQKFQNVNRKCIIVPKPNDEEFNETAIQEYFSKAIISALEGVEGGVLEGVLYLWSLCPNTRDQSKISLPFFTLVKLILQLSIVPKVFPVVMGVHAMNSYDVLDPFPGTISGFCKSVSNENPNLCIHCLDLDPNKELLDQNEELFMNLWVEQTVSTAFRNGNRLQPKIAKGLILANEPLSLPNGCKRFQLVLPKTRLISDLEFDFLDPLSIKQDELEIEVKATALNFRDVFAVLKPSSAFENNAIGIDVAGVVVKVGRTVKKFKVGDKVAGRKMSNISLPSHIKVTEDMFISLPETMTFTEGALFPTVFTTALYCLINIARMKGNETVLIHTASGGVGLAAIQLCKYVGANVIATAGSPRKRAYLKNLGIHHVYHSRNCDFRRKILEITGGCGVDIVLNSLTGPGFKEASMDVLRKGGRFIEMSKLNVWTPQEVMAFRPDVHYEIVDMTQVERKIFQNLLHEMEKFIKEGSFKPIPYERFDALNIRGALAYLQRAHHIGKIVCVMPEVKQDKSKLITITPLFNEDSTYMITGGLGGIGFEVVKWILKNGAKHIAILSRKAPSREIAEQIENFNRAGNHVQSFSVDVGDYEKLKSVFENLPNHGYPPVRGVMHIAGVLNDGVVENQSWDSFRHTFKPKVDGTWNLHELTKDLLLEHFVLFSSIASTLGTPAQANHSASNSFTDSLAAYRRSIGLPATSINWGNWGEVGVATEIDFLGLRPISTSEGLTLLDACLRTQTNQIAVMNVESFALMTKHFPVLKRYVEDIHLLGDFKKSVLLRPENFWNEVDASPDRDVKVGCFKKFIKTIVRNILKMDVDEEISDLSEFQALGIDSLMMLEMKNGLQNILGSRITLTVNQVKDCNNTEIMANTLVNILETNNHDEETMPSHEGLLQLIRDDSNLLPESISIKNLKRVSISDVETVLLTGATGNLGPYLLRELTRRPQIKKVVCLIRRFGKMSCEERLISRLEQVKIIDSVDTSKVEVIEGDLTIPKFGLENNVYENFCESVDAIIHNAAMVDHSVHYWKTPESRKNHPRTVNVIGTLRVLEFAAEKKMKHCFFSSTIVTYTGTGKHGQSDPEGWQDISAFDSIKNEAGGAGYVISKHISEQLVFSSVRRGIPCKVFRFPAIAGDSISGRVDPMRNHLMLRWMSCMKIGAMYDLPFPLILVPVDKCAKISMGIFFNVDAPSDVYNVVHGEIVTEQVLRDVARDFGVQIKIVNYQKFIDLLKSDRNSPLAPLMKLYVDGGGSAFFYENPSILALKKHLDKKNPIDTRKLRKYAQGYENSERASEIVRRDLKYLRDEGILKTFGIEVLHGNN